jgi:hypothetical protein
MTAVIDWSVSDAIGNTQSIKQPSMECRLSSDVRYWCTPGYVTESGNRSSWTRINRRIACVSAIVKSIVHM